MNKKWIRNLIIVAVVLIIAVPVFGSDDTERVWIEYKPGQRVRMQNTLQGMGAQFHYKFDNLNSFVVSVSELDLESSQKIDLSCQFRQILNDT